MSRMKRTLDEHFEYLSLPGRNDLYRQAIAETLKPGDSVADLGSGVGVLGLFCLEAGANRVWGIDHSDAIHLAAEAVKRAGLGDRYECLQKSTFAADLPELVDLLICDHVGFFGFDYGIITMMRDARRRFLKPGGRIIPQSFDMMVALAGSAACLERASGWAAPHIPEAYRWLEGYNRNLRHGRQFESDELMSDAARLGTVALDDVGPDLFVFEATLVAERDGQVDGLAGWFDCQLSDSVRMTNDPRAAHSIRRAQAFCPAAESFAVRAGDAIRVAFRFRADDTLSAWTITPPGGAPRQQLSTFNATLITPADLVRDSGQPLALKPEGEARAFILSLVDGTRSSEQIIAAVLEQRPDIMPSEAALRDFVQTVLTADCRT